MKNKFPFTTSTLFIFLFIFTSTVTTEAYSYGNLRIINDTKFYIWVRDIELTGGLCYGDRNPQQFNPLKPGGDKEEHWTGWCYFGSPGYPSKTVFFISRKESGGLEDAMKNNRKIEATFQIAQGQGGQIFATNTDKWTPFKQEDIASGAKTTPIIKISYAANRLAENGAVAAYGVTVKEVGTETLLKESNPSQISSDILKNIKYDSNYVNIQNKTNEEFTLIINDKELGTIELDSTKRVLVADKNENLVFKLKHADLEKIPEITVPKKLLNERPWTQDLPGKKSKTSYQFKASIVPIYLISQEFPQTSRLEYNLTITQFTPITKSAEVTNPKLIESKINYDPNDYIFKNLSSAYPINITMPDISKSFPLAEGQSLELKQESIKRDQQGSAQVKFSVAIDNSQKPAQFFIPKNIKDTISQLSPITHDNGKKSSDVSVKITPGYYEKKTIFGSEWKVNYTLSINIENTRSL